MKISIITINYNNRDGLERTIISVISQTYKDIQYIVIDGGSTDGSTEVIKQHQEYIDYWVSEPDKGIYNAMNKGVDKAIGDYLLFLNSGDCLHSKSTINGSTQYLTTNEDLIMGQVLFIPSNRIGWDDIKSPITMRDFYLGGPIPHQACFIKHELFDQLRYDENLKIVSDWKFFMQLIVFKECSYKIIKYIISDFEEGGISSDRYACDKERELVFKQLLPKAILLDYWNFSNGCGIEKNNYMSFFADMQKYNPLYGRYVYLVILWITKVLSCIRPSLHFARDYKK